MNKKQILEACIRQCEEKLADLKREFEHLQDAAADDTKSSAGDKYETGREMITQEKQKLAGMEEQQVMHLRILRGLDPDKVYLAIELGALVKTASGIYFLATGLGQVVVDAEAYFVVSPVAPIAQALIGKKAGDQTQFNGRPIEILEVK